MPKQVRQLLRAQPSDGRFRLAEIDPDSTPGLKHRKRIGKEMAADHLKLFELQERLFAEHKRSLLIVLQAMDSGGKDGTVTHVIGNLNPQGVKITAFKAPTPEDRRHGFLWRIRRALPDAGFVGIFNRSQYEDVLIARVHDLAKPEVIERRYGQINEFEKELVRKGTKVVKFFLHISYEEQRSRLLERLMEPDKNWKFNENDINERAYWDDYQSAYSIAITNCSTKWAPWYVIPANDKDYRNWAVSKILLETLDEMDPQYPHPKLDVPRLVRRLKA
ncbi:MAG TPA: polyphosphate kinase 2 family protein [Candidatus Dormibacteraeota bacterium]|nr:polyphosphate kinase 2 family protein [Candidatus Dormibacteraeota bacterium]